MPNPKKGESEQDFVSRYVSSPEAIQDFPDKDQRLAVAYSTYRENTNAIEGKWKDMTDEEKAAMIKSMSKPASQHNSGPECGCTHNESKHAAGGRCGKCECKRFHSVRNQNGQKGTIFPMRFIEPGPVRYAEVGDVLVTKEVLDRMSPSFVGKPIFNEAHRDVSHSDFTEGKADGIIGRVWYDASDGWFWADAIVWDDETIENIKSGYSLSCAYDVPPDGWGPGGTYHNIPYDREVMNGEYTHLAIVPNPRYERARIIYNQGGHMKLKFWPFAKDKKPEEVQASEVELTNSVVEVEGKEVKLEEIVEGFKAEEARKAALANAKPKIGMDDMIDVDGKKVAIKDLVAGHKAHLANASEDALKKAHEDGKHDDKDMENCPMCNSRKEQRNADEKAKKEKEDEEKEKMENGLRLQDHEAGKHTAKALENCLSCKADAAKKDAAHFEELRNAARERKGEFQEPQLSSTADRVAEGQKRYGPKN